MFFEKTLYPVKEVVENAINELTTRAIHEEKQIIIYGEPNQMLICDMDWTGEAIGNLVKNALDHIRAGKNYPHYLGKIAYYAAVFCI